MKDPRSDIAKVAVEILLAVVIVETLKDPKFVARARTLTLGNPVLRPDAIGCDVLLADAQVERR